MVSPISSRARAFVRKRATEVMEYTCRIERVARPSYDEDTLLASPGSRTTVYTGICRIWEVASASQVLVGESDISMQHTQLSIPWNTPEVVKKNDEVIILTAPQDSQIVGKRFQIDSVAKAGELRATRRFNVSMVQEKR